MPTQSSSQCLTLDFGASSCRLMSVGLQQKSLFMREIFRAPNGPIKKGDRLLWPLDLLVANTIQALAKAGSQNEHYLSIGVDTWGVDYVLLDTNNQPIAPPVAYRDTRTHGMIERFTREEFSKDQIYAKTGVQFLPFNTLFQLYAQTIGEPDLLAKVKSLVFIPDYFHFLLAGVLSIEKTIASTSQMWNVTDSCWDLDLVGALALPIEALATPIEPGAEIGSLTMELVKKTGLTSSLRVIAPAAHDTASAVLAVPAQTENWAYLSSGTWSLLGIEVTEPITGKEPMAANWTNEGGYANTFRFMKNINGLWIIQEISRNLGSRHSFAELTEMAKTEPAFVSLINPDDPRFFNPDNMIAAIESYCQMTGQVVPKSPGALVRCAYDSLSLLYRKTLEDLSDLSGNRIDVLHVVGGGSQVAFLNQLTASVTGTLVLAGPVEATALGNGLAQLIATELIASKEAGRTLIAESMPIARFEPESIAGLEQIYDRFNELISSHTT